MSSDGARRIWIVGLLAGLLAAALVAVMGYGGYRQRPVQVGAFTTPYDERVLNDPFEILVVQNDGQAFATLARDPTLSRAATEFRTAEEAAYRAQRPLFPWAGWVLSLGQSGWVAPALVLLTVVGGGLAVSGCAALLVHRRASPWWALLVALLPGFYYSTVFVCPEPLALGLGAWGVTMWERRRPLPAALLLVASALTRETMLVAFGVLVLVALRERDRTRVVAAAAPFVAVSGWFLVLQLRLGHLPFAGGQSRMGWPLEGLRTALDSSPEVVETGNLFYLVAFVALAVACVAVSRRDPLTWIGVAYVAFISLAGFHVWIEAGFARTMLPMGAFGVVALVGAIKGEGPPVRTGAAGAEGSSPRPRTPTHVPGSRAVAPAPPSG